MSTRFAWMLGTLLLILIAFLMACSNYSPSSDGLLIVPSQGTAVIEAFSFNLSTGSTSIIATDPAIPGPPDQGSRAFVILDPTGSFAYLTSTHTGDPLNQPCVTQNSIATYAIKSNGMMNAIGTVDLTNIGTNNPAVALAMDSGGKYLFVAHGAICSSANQAVSMPGYISVFAIGSGASLTPVPGSPFSMPTPLGGASPNPISLTVSPTAFPTLNAACSAAPAPTNEYLYVPDAANNVVIQFPVDPSTGELGDPVAPLPSQGNSGTNTGSAPSGVSIDPCNRFLYVANQNSNNVSVYTICGGSAASPICTANDGRLVQIIGSPIAVGNGPGPLAVDPLGNFLYVVNTEGQSLSNFRISAATGSLSPLSPATLATGVQPVSIAIRSDDQWLFVTNNGSTTGFGSVSEYTITPQNGTLTPAGQGIQTNIYPYGVAVK